MAVETMDTTAEITPDFISRAVDEVRNLKPDYGLLLDLYERIFIEQESSKKGVRLAGYTIPEETLALKQKEKFPLVPVSEFVVDAEAAESLFLKICEILEKADSGISEAVIKISGAVSGKRVDAEKLFSAFLREDETFFAALEQDLAIDAKILNFVAYNSMKPSLVLFSEKISAYLDKEIEWDRGYCPVCGSRPELSVFEDNGKRSLLCGFCGHTWPSKRVYCSFCENTDHETLRYYEIEDEEEYRVDVCDKCNRYIKTVDLKKISRPVYLPLESISTPYIDARFMEIGFQPGNAAINR